MTVILSFFAILAAAGLVLSIASHIAALAGAQGPLGASAWVLHIGIFIVWLPAVLVSNRLVGKSPRRDFWKIALRGCPAWMKYMTYGFFAYAIVNFVVFFINSPKQGNGSPFLQPQVLRGFSGHWMAFYSAALAILYSASKLWDDSQERRCPNGHRVQALAKFCDQCGLPVAYLGQPQNRL